MCRPTLTVVELKPLVLMVKTEGAKLFFILVNIDSTPLLV
jgi:hypothetical protein